MKTLIFLLFPLAAFTQRPIASLYAGVSPYHLQAGLEAGVAQIIDERYSIVAFAHGNSIGKQAILSAGVKFYGAIWLDFQRESFIAPVIAFQNRYSHTDNDKDYRATTGLFGLRYQVYGGYGEVLAQPGYIAFTVGYQFGNVKR
jgi:hypothetical protein